MGQEHVVVDGVSPMGWITMTATMWCALFCLYLNHQCTSMPESCQTLSAQV